jgi:dihydroorotase
MISINNEGIFNPEDAIDLIGDIFNVKKNISSLYWRVFFTDLGNDFYKIKGSEKDIEEFSKNFQLSSGKSAVQLNKDFRSFLETKTVSVS